MSPGARSDRRSTILRSQIRALLDVGIRTVIDLRTPAEPPGIRPLLEKLATEAQAVAWVGLPILNGDAPSPSLLELTLDIIDASLARERGVYVHCAGGRGRTGTVVTRDRGAGPVGERLDARAVTSICARAR